MTMNGFTPLTALVPATSAQGDGGSDKLLGHMRNVAEQSLEFQSMLLELQKGYSTFHLAIQSKQEALKSMTEIARDGIRKSGER